MAEDVSDNGAGPGPPPPAPALAAPEERDEGTVAPPQLDQPASVAGVKRKADDDGLMPPAPPSAASSHSDAPLSAVQPPSVPSSLANLLAEPARQPARALGPASSLTSLLSSNDDTQPLASSSAQWPAPSSDPVPMAVEVVVAAAAETTTVGLEAEDDADDGIIRCLCDYTVDDGFTIMCDNCQVWQHGVCVGVPTVNDVPEVYYCDQCDPSLARRRALLSRRAFAQEHQRARLAHEESVRLSRSGHHDPNDPTYSSAPSGSENEPPYYPNLASSSAYPPATPADASGTGATPGSGGKRGGANQASPALSAGTIAAPDSRGAKKKRTSLPKGTSPGGGGGAGGGDGDDMPAPKEVPSRTGTGEGKKEVKRRPKPRASRASIQMAAAEQEQVRLSTTLLPQGPTPLSSFGYAIGGALPGGMGLPPLDGEEEGGEKYESWRYEFTPVAKDRWPLDGRLKKEVADLAKEYAVAGGDEDRWRGEKRATKKGQGLVLPAGGGKDAGLLSVLKGAVVPFDAGEDAPTPAKLTIKPLAASAITLAPSFSVPFSTPTVQASSLCPYPRSTVYGVFAAQPIPAGSFIVPLRGEIKQLEAYRDDPVAQYGQLGVPKPGVRAIARPWSLVIDARQWGNEARFIRSGCHPNSVALPVISSSSVDPVTFGVFATTDIGRRDEIVLPWDWDDLHTVHLLPTMLRSKGRDVTAHFPLDAVHLATRKMAHVATMLLGVATCACEKKKDCALAATWRLGGLTEKTSVNKGGQKGPFAERLKAALAQIAEPGGGTVTGTGGPGGPQGPGKGSKATKRKQKVDLGPLLGLRRGWTEAEEAEAIIDASRASTPRVEESVGGETREQTAALDETRNEDEASVKPGQDEMEVDDGGPKKKVPTARKKLTALFESDDEAESTPMAGRDDASDSDAETVLRSGSFDDDDDMDDRRKTRRPPSMSATPGAGAPVLNGEDSFEGPQRRQAASPEPMQVDLPALLPPERPPPPPPRRISLKDLMQRRGTDKEALALDPVLEEARPVEEVAVEATQEVAPPPELEPEPEPEPALPPPPPRTKVSLAAYLKRRPAPLDVPSSTDLGLGVATAGDAPQAVVPPLAPVLAARSIEKEEPAATPTSEPQPSRDETASTGNSHFRFPSFSSALGLASGRQLTLNDPTPTSPPPTMPSGLPTPGLGPPATISAPSHPRLRSPSPPEQPPSQAQPSRESSHVGYDGVAESSRGPTRAGSTLSLRYDSPTATREIPTGPRALAASPQTALVPPSGPRGHSLSRGPLPSSMMTGSRVSVGAGGMYQPDSRWSNRSVSPRLNQDHRPPGPTSPAGSGDPGRSFGPPMSVGDRTPGQFSATAPPRAPRAFQQQQQQGPPPLRAAWPPPPSGPRSAAEAWSPTSPAMGGGGQGPLMGALRTPAAPGERARYEGVPRGPAAMAGSVAGPGAGFPGRGRAKVRGGGGIGWGMGRGRGRGI